MKHTMVSCVLVILMLLLPPRSYGKQACKKYLDKLHKVQAKQRTGHSLKQSNKLREQENSAREVWWQCEKSDNKKNKKISAKKSAKKTVKSSVKPQKIAKNSSPSLATTLKRAPGNISPFASSTAIEIKAKYQGQQQLDWLAFYQQPKKCYRPENLKIFAACVEDKRHQQVLFEQNNNESD